MDRLQVWALVGILAGSVALSVAYNVFQPIWEAPDESAHFGFVRYVQINRALPRASPDVRPLDQPWSLTNEYSQTPLYYVLLAEILGPLNLPPDAGPHLNPYVTWPGHPWRLSVVLHRTDEGWPYHGLAEFVRVGRLVSTALGLVALAATFAMLRALTGSPNLALFGTAWLSLCPVYLLASSRLNNDAGALATGAITLFLCTRLLTVHRPAGLVLLIVASLGLTAALLTKLDTVFLVALLLVASGYAVAPGEPLAGSLRRRLLVPLAVLVLPVGTLAAWWVGYGSSAGSSASAKAGFEVLDLLTVVRHFDGYNFLNAIWSWNATWWGGIGFGSLSPWPPAVYAVLAVPFAVLLGLGIRSLTLNSRSERSLPSHLAVAILSISSALVVYATIVRASVPDVGLDANARFSLPAAPVLALLVTYGLAYLTSGRARSIAAWSYLGLLLFSDVALAVVWLPTIPTQPIPARLAAPGDVSDNPPLIRFTNGVDLVAINGVPETLRPNSQMSLRLTWMARSVPKRDFTAFVQIVNSADQKRIVALDAIPLESVFPPRLWQVGEIIEEKRTLRLPETFEPGHYVLLLGAYYYLDGNGIEPISGRSATASGASAALREWLVPSALSESGRVL
jgi:hypothetical protein